MANVGKKTGKQTQAGRDVYETPEGEMVSEKSTTFEYKGKWINIPTIHGGKQYSEDQLMEMLDKGLIEPTSIHDELEEAIKAAQSRSDSLEFNKGGTPMEEQMELFEDGGLRDEGGMVDEESGNEVPNGSTRKEVRDDVPAMLSEGEFVLPADVVRYHGLEKIMQLRDEAKLGLKKMEAMGQMGNSDEATLDDDVPFGPADLLIIAGEPEDKPREMAEGGVVYAQEGTYVQPATGIMGYQPSIYQGQQTSTTYTPPPSSVAPPTPTPSPAGGYVPKFVSAGATPFNDGSLPPQPVATPTTTDTSAVSTASTETKFVPEVQDKYTTLKYINKETNEIRDFYFYNGNPVTPIPDGFIPYDESVDETVDDLESTTVETTQVRGSDDDDPFKDLPKPEAVDYSKLSTDELLAAFDQNKNARLALTAMGVVNPMIALFGRFATGQQQKNILAEMEARGMKVPETKGNIIDRISDMVSGIFNKDKDEVKKTVIESEKTGPSYNIPNSLTDDDMGLPTEPVDTGTRMSSGPTGRGGPAKITPSSGPSTRGGPAKVTPILSDDDMGLPSGPVTIPSTSSTNVPLGPEDFAPKPTTKKEDDPFKDLNDAVERIKAKQASNKVIKEAQKRGDSSAVSSAIKEAKRVEDIIEARQKGASIGFKQGGLASRKKKK
jgi:hypothetical protein